ncbi:MAG: hypothetical protein M3R30_05420 [Candidatus Eremiobacteraeota bacterium]|nr:hypothetical protein [Candidatus Eremiobacteraeota bacterium]
MSRCSLALAPVLLLALAACGKHELAVTAKQCDAVSNPGGASVTVKVHNGADKPVVNVGIQIDFYHDFKFDRVSGVGIFHPAIAPNSDADTSLVITDKKATNGQAQRCAVVHTTYADGSQEDATTK